MDKLNNLKNFSNGTYSVIRDGEVITLNQEEINDILLLDIASKGKIALTSYYDMFAEDLDEPELETLTAMINDDNDCLKVGGMLLEETEEEVEDIINVVEEAMNEYLGEKESASDLYRIAFDYINEAMPKDLASEKAMIIIESYVKALEKMVKELAE